jgi:short-subunit dehydrogenase
MHPDKAARAIRKGLEANKPRIAFPLPMYALVRLMAALPSSLVEKILSDMPRKASFN